MPSQARQAAICIDDDDDVVQATSTPTNVSAGSVLSISGLRQRPWLSKAAATDLKLSSSRPLSTTRTMDFIEVDIAEVDADAGPSGACAVRGNQELHALQIVPHDGDHSDHDDGADFMSEVSRNEDADSSGPSQAARSHDQDSQRTSATTRQADSLKRQLAKKNKLIRRLRQQLKAAQKKVKNVSKGVGPTGRRTQLQKALEKRKLQMETSKGNTFELVKSGRMLEGRRGRLTYCSMYAIGIRRALSNVAAADFGLLNCCDISGQTVQRCEARSAAALNLLMRDHCQEMLNSAQTIHYDLAPGHWSVSAIAYRSDSTNSRVWRRQKLHVLDCSVTFIRDYDLWRDGKFEAAIARRRSVHLD